MKRLARIIFISLGIIIGLSSFWFIQGKAHPKDKQNPYWIDFGSSPGASIPVIKLTGSNEKEIGLIASLPGCMAEDLKVNGQAYTRLAGDGYGHSDNVGLPDLPVVRQEVEIPFGASVGLEIVDQQYTDTSLGEMGLLPVYPLQPPVVKLPGAQEEPPFLIDQAFYASHTTYPATPVKLGEPYIIRGHRIVTVGIWPVAYNPGEGSVRFYSQVNFRITLTGSDMSQTREMADRYASPVYESLLADQVLNFNQNQSLHIFPPVSNIQYLIITADAFENALQPFIALKQSRGFDVTVTKLSQIPGGASIANIKAYIQNAYDNWPNPPSYLLLVGDTDTIAAWQSTQSPTTKYTDLYYATMDGESDWHPDLGRGRFPARSAAQVTDIVNKYIVYAGFTGQEAWLKKAAFIATCDREEVAEATHNYVINNKTGPGGYTGMFPNIHNYGGDQIYCIAYGGSATNIRNAANDGRWALIYSGHGSETGWADGAVSFSQTDVRNLTDFGFFPFVASHACVTGSFGSPSYAEAYGETWVLQPDKGALVFWGASHNTYWDEDDELERQMFNSLFRTTLDHPRTNEMTDFALTRVEMAYPGSARYYWEAYNIMGDASVRVFMEPEMPTFTMNVDHASLEVCSVGNVETDIKIGSIHNYSSTVYLENGSLPIGVAAAFTPIFAQAPFTSTLVFGVDDSAIPGDYTIPITASDHILIVQNGQVNLRMVEDTPNSPILVSPVNGAVNQPLQPVFDWSDLPLTNLYSFQLAFHPLFKSPVTSINHLPESIYPPELTLIGGRCYWWQTRGENACGEGDWSDPFHFATLALGITFNDDMESGDGKWLHNAVIGIDHWLLSSAQSHSPAKSWFVPDDNTTTDSRLWTKTPITIGSGSILSFWHRYNFESSTTPYDGSVIEISTNGGSIWSDLGTSITSNGYTGVLSSGYGNPLAGRQAWTGNLDAWTKVTVNLNSFAGQTVLIRWRLGCDSSVQANGWYIDDIQITTPLPSNPAPQIVTVFPNSGLLNSETPIQVQGSNFIETPALRLGNTWLFTTTLVNSTTVNAVVPANLSLGVYNLTLYNGDCQTTDLDNAFTVTSGEAPEASLFVDHDPVKVNQPVQFTVVVTGTQPTSYQWDFGGSGSGTGMDTATPIYTYNSAGDFQVELTIDGPWYHLVITRSITVEWYKALLPIILLP